MDGCVRQNLHLPLTTVDVRSFCVANSSGKSRLNFGHSNCTCPILARLFQTCKVSFLFSNPVHRLDGSRIRLGLAFQFMLKFCISESFRNVRTVLMRNQFQLLSHAFRRGSMNRQISPHPTQASFPSYKRHQISQRQRPKSTNWDGARRAQNYSHLSECQHEKRNLPVRANIHINFWGNVLDYIKLSVVKARTHIKLTR